MHTIKITPNLLFEYQCTSGKFIRLPNRIESNRNFFERIGMLYYWAVWCILRMTKSRVCRLGLATSVGLVWPHRPSPDRHQFVLAAAAAVAVSHDASITCVIQVANTPSLSMLSAVTRRCFITITIDEVMFWMRFTGFPFISTIILK